MKIFSVILVFLSILVISYLVGSFIGASFDITTWNDCGRFLIAMMGMVIASSVAFFVYTEEVK